jgi:shikimate kinase
VLPSDRCALRGIGFQPRTPERDQTRFTGAPLEAQALGSMRSSCHRLPADVTSKRSFGPPGPFPHLFNGAVQSDISPMTAAVRSIVLIGMMGAGKSSVGRCLERRTGLRRFDTDDMVAKRFGKSVTEIFSKLGEEQFRTAETEVLANLAPTKPAIIVTGGGIVLREENVAHLKRLGVVVWLDADESVLFERATRRGNRPLLKTADPRATLTAILDQRLPLYTAAADLRIDTTGRAHEEVADLILSEIETRTVGAK